MGFIVAIDGPAGTGKSTLTRRISKKLGYTNIDTGAMYRCVALEMLNNKIELKDISKIKELLQNINIDFKELSRKQLVFLNGKDVTKDIRTPEVTGIVSPVSSIKEIRYKMVDLQRELAKGKNIIMEGRDITTYVFPNADVKIYLDATLEERTKRRYKEEIEKGTNLTYEQVLENIKSRDENDKAKEVGALKIAEDATYIDTTELSLIKVERRILDIISNKREGTI